MTTRTEISKKHATNSPENAIPDSVLINVASAMKIKTYAKLQTLAESIGKLADMDYACEALSIEKKEPKIKETRVITTNVGEYEGNAVFQFKSGNYNYLSFGKEKAKIILANIDKIAAFANS